MCPYDRVEPVVGERLARRRNLNIKARDTRMKMLLAVSSGILSFLAFPPFEFAFLAWVALVPMLCVFRYEVSIKEAFFYPFLAGVIFFSGLLSWLAGVTIPGMIILIIVLSSLYGIFGLGVKYVLKASVNFLAIPLMWVILEYTRGFIFTGFPWGLLAYSQYTNLNLIQIADLTGAYGVSFIIAAVNTAFAAWGFRLKRKVAYLMTALLLIVVAVTYGIFKFKNYYVRGSFKASVVQGNIPQDHKWDAAFADEIIEKYVNLTEKTVEQDSPDMVIWPETAYPYLVENMTEAPPEIAAFIEKWKTPLLAGVVVKRGDEYFNSAMLFDQDAKVSGFYSKTHLVPFGEYIPFKKAFSFLREHIDKPIGNFERGGDYDIFRIKSVVLSSSEKAKTRRTDFYKFGVLICFEDVFPYITRKFVKKGANFMVTITNDAWFGKTAAAREHLQASVFRAVENRVPMIRAANTGISCFIDSTGKILKVAKKNGKEIFVSAFLADYINMYVGRVYYTTYGDVFMLFCGVVLILLVGIEKILKKAKFAKNGSIR